MAKIKVSREKAGQLKRLLKELEEQHADFLYEIDKIAKERDKKISAIFKKFEKKPFKL